MIRLLSTISSFFTLVTKQQTKIPRSYSVVVQSGGRKAAPNVSSIPPKTTTHQHDFVTQKYFALERKQCDSDDEQKEKAKNNSADLSNKDLKNNIDPASLTVNTEIMKVS